MDIEQGLHSIPEVDEPLDAELLPSGSPASFSIGGFLGRIVNFTIRSILTIFSTVFRLLGYITWTFGQLIAAVFITPKSLLNRVNLASLTKFIIVVVCVSSIWHYLRHNAESLRLPNISWSSPRGSYQPPSTPVSDFAELSARLQAFEAALSSLSLENERARLRLEKELNRGKSEFSGRLGALETKVQKEGVRALEVDSNFRQSAGQVQQEIEALRSQVASMLPKGGNEESEEETRGKLKLLEERMGSMEGGLKEALELGKNAVKVGTSAGVAAWWSKLATGNPGSSLTIKSADGQDVTSLITHLVDSVTSKYTKDVLARPDFALHSGGAQVIPSLTSPTYEIWPVGAANQIIGIVTGSGHAVGRPPVTALHHDINNGHCWPFAGTQGQLGVKLAWPALISEVTIDHVARDVAFDMRSAPREMELWGLVEGKDNLGKLNTWLAEKQARREKAVAAGEAIRPEDEDWVYPRGLPKSLQYARIASFTYDIHSPANIQTYPAAQDLCDLGVDFGLVVLFVKNNWGRDEFTCLYRLRVHGERVGAIPLPYDPESEAS
jgi:SUN domain-containing protein 1/2